MKHRKTSQRDSSSRDIRPTADFSIDETDSNSDSTAQLVAVPAAYELRSNQSTSNQASTLAVNATIRIAEEIVSRSVPLMINYFTRKHDCPIPLDDNPRKRKPDTIT